MQQTSKLRVDLVITLLAGLVLSTAPSAQAQGRPKSLPANAREIAHGVYDLGQAQDVDGTVVQGYAFIHYKKQFAKPGGGKPSKSGSCYSFLASGAKWKALEPYVVDENLKDSQTVLASMDDAISEWEGYAGPILGQGIEGPINTALLGNEMNGLNEVTFGDLGGGGVIAMTITWGVFGGPPHGRYLAEWDMIFDTGWTWSFADVGVPGTMDFLNIATHELGHAMGLGHPSATCTEETMYAYADFAEIKKRDLNAGDILGITALYAP